VQPLAARLPAPRVNKQRVLNGWSQRPWLGAARVLRSPLQPGPDHVQARAMLRAAFARPGQSVRELVGAEQLPPRPAGSARATARFLSFERMPNRAPCDRQPPVQLLGSAPAALGPGGRLAGATAEGRFSGRASHWTRGAKGIHPGAMAPWFCAPEPGSTVPMAGCTASRPWLAVWPGGERLGPRDTSSAARRLRQRLELASVCWIPCLKPLRQAVCARGRPFWKALRWGERRMLLPGGLLVA